MLADLPLLLGRPRIPSEQRLAGERALVVTATLERRGWRAEAVYLVGQLYLIEARDPSVRGHPLVATLRTEDDYDGFRRQYPGPRPASRRRPRGTPGGWWVAPEPAWPAKPLPPPVATATWPEVTALRKSMGIGCRSLARRLGVPRSSLEYAERFSHSEAAARMAGQVMAILRQQTVDAASRGA